MSIKLFIVAIENDPDLTAEEVCSAINTSELSSDDAKASAKEMDPALYSTSSVLAGALGGPGDQPAGTIE